MTLGTWPNCVIKVDVVQCDMPEVVQVRTAMLSNLCCRVKLSPRVDEENVAEGMVPVVNSRLALLDIFDNQATRSFLAPAFWNLLRSPLYASLAVYVRW